MKTLILAAALVTWATGASAHIVFSPDNAAAGGYYAGELHVSHGCGGAATTAITVTIPPGVTVAKPQPKPGWTLAIDREPLPKPVTGEGGAMIRDRVARITWRGGPLPDDEFESFGLLMKLPAAAGPLYAPAVQTCDRGETRWTDIPAAGQAWHSVPHPAPVITLTAADGMTGMGGMEHGGERRSPSSASRGGLR